jgi:Carboxylesterase family
LTKLGAFGFLSSDEVFRNGVINAGILDQTFALQWVQAYVGLFGGNKSQVTISGESAGGGSVMLQTMAYGGYLGDSLFSNVSGTKRDICRIGSNELPHTRRLLRRHIFQCSMDTRTGCRRRLTTPSQLQPDVPQGCPTEICQGQSFSALSLRTH